MPFVSLPGKRDLDGRHILKVSSRGGRARAAVVICSVGAPGLRRVIVCSCRILPRLFRFQCAPSFSAQQKRRALLGVEVILMRWLIMLAHGLYGGESVLAEGGPERILGVRPRLPPCASYGRALNAEKAIDARARQIMLPRGDGRLVAKTLPLFAQDASEVSLESCLDLVAGVMALRCRRGCMPRFVEKVADAETERLRDLRKVASREAVQQYEAASFPYAEAWRSVVVARTLCHPPSFPNAANAGETRENEVESAHAALLRAGGVCLLLSVRSCMRAFAAFTTSWYTGKILAA